MTVAGQSGKQGLTLVETLIASCILALVLTGSLTAIVYARRCSVHADVALDGVHRAQTHLEAIRSYGYDDTRLAVGTHVLPDGTYTVALSPTFSATKDITLTVNWIAPATATPHSFTIATSITRTLHP